MKKMVYYFVMIFVACYMIFGVNTVYAKNDIISIGGKMYDDFFLALQEVKTGEVIKLIQDVDLTDIDDVHVVDFPDNVVFDLDGHNINIKWIDSAGIGNLIFEGSNITIKNGSFSGKLSYSLWIGDEKESNHIVLENLKTDGGVNVYHASDVILKDVEALGHDYYAVWVDNDASVVIQSGNYRTNGKNGLVGISTGGSGSSLKIKGGTFKVNDQKLLPNNMKPSISGGTFNINVDSYLEAGYQCVEKNGSYKVNKIVHVSKVEALALNYNQNYTESTLGVSNLNVAEKVILDVLENSDEVDIINKNVKVVIDTNKISVSDTIIHSIREFLNQKKENMIVSDYFDISIHVIDVDNNTMLGKLTNLNNKITFTVALPEQLQKVNEGYQRNFYIVRNHNNNYEILDTVLSNNSQFLTFEADQFSTYALVYNDEKILENPNTYDNSSFNLVIQSISFIGLIGIYILIRKKKILG